MKFTETAIPGAFVIEMEPHCDHRGSFARAWCKREFSARGLKADFVQCNLSRNVRKHTLRGLHYQKEPAGEDKLVQCIRGALFDVMVDLRPDSPSYQSWFGLTLSGADAKLLYVPAGCAHGFLTLEDGTEAIYDVTAYYTPELEAGLRWNDPAFNIDWPEAEAYSLSDKDRNWPDFIPAS